MQLSIMLIHANWEKVAKEAPLEEVLRPNCLDLIPQVNRLELLQQKMEDY